MWIFSFLRQRSSHSIPNTASYAWTQTALNKMYIYYGLFIDHHISTWSEFTFFLSRIPLLYIRFIFSKEMCNTCVIKLKHYKILVDNIVYHERFYVKCITCTLTFRYFFSNFRITFVIIIYSEVSLIRTEIW